MSVSNPKTTLLISPIKELISPRSNDYNPILGQAMNNVNIIKNGAIAVSDHKILAVGTAEAVNQEIKVDENTQIINAQNNLVIPGFVDPHTHLVFAGNRANEFVQRNLGKTYQEIAALGGGILHTVAKTRDASLDNIIELGLNRLKLMLATGTTTCEVKTGYGLDTISELKLLEAILKLNKLQQIDLIPTFMPAHAIPVGSTETEYTNEIINKMLAPAKKLICDYYDINKPYFTDVFCDQGYFGKASTINIMKKYLADGFQGKIHANEFVNLNVVPDASKLGIKSFDHMLNVNDSDIKALKNSSSIAVLLPGTSFFLNLESHAPARKLIENSVAVAIGSDFNPGSCHIFSMPFIFGLACLKLKMTPQEVLTATTYNAACAVGAQAYVGQIDIGFNADINILNLESLEEIPYNLAINPISQVIKNGKVVYTNK